MNTCPKQAAALEAIYAITYFDQDVTIALLECMLQKVKGSYVKSVWQELPTNVIDDLITDMKWEQAESMRGEEPESYEMPYMGRTLSDLEALGTKGSAWA